MIIKKRSKKTGEEKKIDTEVLLTVTSDTVVESSSEDNVVDVEVEESSAVSEPEIDLFDIENIDFTQRQEHRRGSRRRGYRRIDDRNLEQN